MKQLTALTLLLCSLFAYLPASETYEGVCQSRFSGTSSLRNFSGQVTSKPFKVTIDIKDNQLFANWDTPITVKKMKTSNTIQDSKMYEMFNYQKYPIIKGHFTNLNLSKLSKQSTVPFTLTIRKKKKVIHAEVTDWKISDSKISFSLKFPVLLSDFQLKPPSLFGTVKVGDEVTVKSKFTLTKQQ